MKIKSSKTSIVSGKIILKMIMKIVLQIMEGKRIAMRILIRLRLVTTQI